VGDKTEVPVATLTSVFESDRASHTFMMGLFNQHTCWPSALMVGGRVVALESKIVRPVTTSLQ
jgi:hypothetical protein